MSPLSNSEYSSIFMYNPYVLTRSYRNVTFVALIVPHHITCILHDISISIVGVGDQAWYAEWIPLRTIKNELATLQQKFHLNASDDGLYKYSLPFITVRILRFICNFTSSNSYTREQCHTHGIPN